MVRRRPALADRRRRHVQLLGRLGEAQVAGRDFADEAEFARLVKTLPGPLALLVERDGRLRTVEIRLDWPPLERAA